VLLTGNSKLEPASGARDSQLLFTHAAQLLTLLGPNRARRGAELRELGIIPDGAVLLAGGHVAAVGATDEVARGITPRERRTVEEIDCRGKLIAPGLVDSHNHLVFAAARLGDFERRIEGASYEEIARGGGGILSSVERLRGASEEQLVAHSRLWLGVALHHGTTTIEIKSGYGLNLEQELRMLRIAHEVAEADGVSCVRTFLGAHTVPQERASDRTGYVREIVENMLPAVARERAAEFCDVFCERGAFSVSEAEAILRAALQQGLGVRLHTEQLSRSGGTALGVRLGAASVDHLEYAEERDFAALAGSQTVATLLPGCNFFMDTPPAKARRMIAGGVAVALATDFNPGTCPIISLPVIMAIACTKLRLTPAETWVAATINGAAALRRADVCGSIEPGKRADLAIFDADDYRAVPYFAGTNVCSETVVAGRRKLATSNEQ
jgi:imidazolonepropionase